MGWFLPAIAFSIFLTACMESGTEVSGNFGQNPLKAALALTVNDAATVTEGEAMIFKIQLNAVSPDPVTYSYQTQNGTAVAGTDYSTNTGSGTFLPGETEKTISVTTLDNETLDGIRQLSLAVSQVSGALVSRASGTGSVTDNEPTTVVEFLTSSQSISEIAGSASVTIKLSESSADTVTVPYTLSGTASSPSDYNLSNGTLTFSPGQTVVVLTIPIVDDVTPEIVESLVISLGTPVHARSGTKLIHTITITDND